jgi:hypothetical protein
MTEAEVIDRINSTIKKNGNRTITGDEMNFILKAIIELIVESGGTLNWGDIEGTIADQLDLVAALNNKVDVVSGKGLSTNDFTNTLKSKLDGIEAGAEVNVKADWTATSGDAEILNKPTIPNPANFVAKSDYTPAHSVLVQQSGTGSPTAVTIGTNEFLGRKSGGGSNIEGLSVSEAKAILNYTASDVGAPSGSGTSSGTNTGDETNATIKSKLGAATSSVDGYLTAANFTTFNNKANKPSATSGIDISFRTAEVYNTRSSAGTGNITGDYTSAIIGLVQKIYHNDSVAPTVPGSWIKLGTGTYTLGTLNIIYVEWISSNIAEYWIVKGS